MIYLKTEDEIEMLRKANLLVAATLAEIAKIVQPGVTTRKMDTLAEHFIRDNGAVSTLKGCHNPFGPAFPASICTSVNDTIVHGIPDDQPLQNGDIVSVDCGVLLEGFCGDSCYTFCVGEVKAEIKKLLSVTKESLYKGIEKAIVGNRLGDIGHAVQHHVQQYGYGVVRQYTGHGIGKQMHEAPMAPNYGTAGTGIAISNGLCIAIEPMITEGGPSLYLLPDRWGVKTRDGKCAAHFEHTIAVHHGKAEILSSFEDVEQIERTKH
ncbi:methionine aminopeptidase [Alloprevotella rava F0323]|uniref:Methionine aminopeptidase n=1 Tax=Alloprevotella rava F0323 TaxID=679199 RepID=G5GE85_9BACT|nr:type I methionyl aminopeptidase [Alloprevotella rava]EHG21072.1 methionine aminopeptidase [Alloprevotella rava F0323]